MSWEWWKSKKEETEEWVAPEPTVQDLLTSREQDASDRLIRAQMQAYAQGALGAATGPGACYFGGTPHITTRTTTHSGTTTLGSTLVDSVGNTLSTTIQTTVLPVKIYMNTISKAIYLELSGALYTQDGVVVHNIYIDSKEIEYVGSIQDLVRKVHEKVSE